ITALAETNFRELTIRLDHAVHEAPVNIRIDAGAGLVAIGEKDDAWHYSVISLEDGSIVATGEFPESAIYYDTGDVQGLGIDQLCFLSADGLSALDLASGAINDIAEIDSIYHGDPVQGPAYLDFVRDINDDGSEFVLTPSFTGWLVATHRDSGTAHFQLEIPPRVTVYGLGVNYRPRQPQIGDANGDGLNDVVFLVDREFISFQQTAGSRFDTKGRRDGIAAPLATEKQRARWARDDGQVDQSDLEIEEVELVRDFNDDDILDLLTEKSISEGVFDRRSEYHLYLGHRDGESLTYAASPDGSIASGGVQFEPVVVDVDGDGRMDIATPSTKLSLTRVVGALFSGRMGVDLDVYRMREDGSYPDESDYQTRFKVEFDLKTGLSRYPAVAIADFDGDGLSELVLQKEKDELTFYPGIGAPKIFGKKTQTLELELPRNGQMVKAGDLNDDGRDDLLVRYGPADGEDLDHELLVLMSEQD
ncbi:MAG: FG-GAP-like repeat-containing protein, partial [Gammaproteobacteria bacterium]